MVEMNMDDESFDKARRYAEEHGITVREVVRRAVYALVPDERPSDADGVSTPQDTPE